MGKKGLEMVWWTLIVLVLAIIIITIFYVFIRFGILHIERINLNIFSAPQNFSENLTNLSSK